MTDMLAKLTLEEATKVESDLVGGDTSLDVDGKKVTLSKDMISVKKYQKTFHVEEIIPSVIEPSFGVGRVMYAIFEHNFKVILLCFSYHLLIPMLGQRRGRTKNFFLTSSCHLPPQVLFTAFV